MNLRKDTTVIILAAGLGTRLRPFTNETPKCMVSINGTPIIQQQLNILEQLGFQKIVIVGGYKSENLEKLGRKIYK